MSESKKKHKIAKIVSIVCAAVVLLVFIALIIVNCFIPVKYLTAYCVKKSEKEEFTMRVTFVNVGYGDCTVVEFPDGKTALIDGGDGGYSHTHKILSTLNSLNIDKLDYLVCSSVSSERCGGLSEVIKYKSAQKIFVPYCPVTYINSGYRKFYNAVKDGNLTVVEYGTGIFNDLYGYKLCFLSPSDRDLQGGEYDNFIKSPNETSVNNCSAIIWLEYGGTSFLLLGNTDAEVQDKLCAGGAVGIEIAGRLIDLKSCDVVKVACHGAASSVNADLFELINPGCAVLSVGENGRGLPSVQSIASAQRFVGNEFYRTDINGNITFTVKTGNSYSLNTEKQ